MARIRLLYLILSVLTVASCKPAARSAGEAARAELELHPQSRLSDLYKYFFQDVFGPGHLVSDPAGAASYLDRELARAIGYEDFDLQELIYRKQFVRVNLRVVAAGRVDKQTFMTAFLESANSFRIPEVSEWHKEWRRIERVLRKSYAHLPGYDDDRRYIDSLLTAGDYVVHHSRDYINTYDPHYRIIHRDQMKLLNLKE